MMFQSKTFKKSNKMESFGVSLSLKFTKYSV